MKRVRLTLIIASIGISSSLVMGSVYARSDAGLVIKAWYKSRIQLSQQQVQQAALRHKLLTLVSSIDGATWKAVQSLTGTWNTGENEVDASITAKNEAYIEQLKQAELEILSAPTNEAFDTYVSQVQTRQADELEQLVRDTIHDSMKSNNE
ncbi:hypothetical protein SY83_09685 [Paenibacillus swuensis]|uniref:Uncharacterized protein n=1 Tax=Paenibacillus swuensis TaxID=1178515 RepID=A0A172THY4_9BACL|nr:hypothetical protein [Paenibacillus swuensis]ANE46504.1 hypothetical protein SY83_09685 [Paenibacillus swuensis]